MERAYRYGLALEDRPGTPDDWLQAREVLDRVDGSRSIRAFAPLRARLAARLSIAEAPRAAAPAPAWLDEHLLGFVAECQTASDPDPGSSAETVGIRRAAIERALGHYERALAARPGSFWAHHRAASACFGLGRRSDAARHLERCLERRPDNAVVRAQLASCLIERGRASEALEQADLALQRAPNHAELYRTRIFARLASRQTGGVREDVMHYEKFRRVLPPSLWGGPDSEDPGTGLIGATFQGLVDPRAGPAGRRGRESITPVDSEEIDDRANIAEALFRAELFPLARAEYEKVLVLKPDHIPARIQRAEHEIAERRFDAARADLTIVLDHPGLEEYIRGYSGSMNLFILLTRQYLKAGRLDDARWLIERTRQLAIDLHRDVGQFHLDSAQVYAALGASDPDYIEQAAAQLFRAFIAYPGYQELYRNPNRWFDPVRSRIDAALGRLEDPMAVRGRLLARRAAKPAGH
jgi:tetratricopeptide (TPR) repeat protein